jgi:outer membrane protein assembly factor BamB
MRTLDRARLLLLVPFLLAGLLGVQAAAPPVPTNEDVTKTVAAWNSAKYASPPAQFRQGHVTPRQLDPKALARTNAGYTIQLPSKAPVATPTVAGGKVYVSGGFRSKEFYCFDAATGKLAWAINLDDDGPSSAVVEDGVCVFNTESCTIFAVNARTGKHLWSHWLGDPLTSTPTIANGKVFTSYPARGRGQQQMNNRAGGKQPAGKPAPPCSHVLAALDLKTGKILWQRWIDSDVMSAPVAVENDLYATSFAGVVYRFKQAAGQLVSAVRSRATSAPVVVGNNVYLTRRADTGRGEAREQVAGLARHDNRTLVAGQSRAAAYIDPKVQEKAKLRSAAKSLDAANGFAGGAPAAANASVAEDNIGQANVSTLQAFQGSRLLNSWGRNFSCMGDEIVCADPRTGKNLWSVKLQGDLKKQGGFLAAPPAAAGGQLFLATLNGAVLQLDPTNGKVTKTHKVGAAVRQQPAIVGGRIFVGTQDGKLVVIDTGDRKLTGWTTWGGNSAHTGAIPAGAKK